jgi:predicted phosphoribosyltransferase
MAKRAYVDASVPQAMRAAKRLAHLIREQGWRTFGSRDVLRLERAGLATAEELAPALAALEDAGLIRPVAAPRQPQGGRPQRRYEVHPAMNGGQP